MLQYPGSDYLNAIKYKREQENAQPNILNSFGQGMGAGIVKGVDAQNASSLAKLAEERDFNTKFIIKLFDDNTPVTIKNPNATDPTEKYSPVPITQYQSIADTLRKNGQLPAGIYFIPTSTIKPSKPTTEYEEKGADIIDSSGKIIGKTSSQIVTKGHYVPPFHLPAQETGLGSKQANAFMVKLNTMIDNASTQKAQAESVFDEKNIVLYDAQIKNLQNASSYFVKTGDIEGTQGLIKDYDVIGEPSKETKDVDVGGLGFLTKNKDVTTPSTLKAIEKPPVRQPVTPPTGEIRRKTKDGKIAVFDANKKFLRYE